VNGYKDALIKNKLKQESDLIKLIHFENINEDVEKALTELIQQHPDLDAIYALNNHIATALLKTLKKKGFENYNGRLKIACFDDIELFNIIDKKVTSVSQPIEEIGKNASLLMLDIIDGKQVNKSNVVLSTKVIER
jgi:DNA-binding LacI/PurR family transcriptional regulator